MKKQLLLFLAVLLPMMASADDSGTCGDNLTWTYIEATHTLTISGEGNMANCSWNTKPWHSYENEMTKVIIEDGVTSIGDYAFKDCSGLTSITIPNSVTSIGDYAFMNCSGLISVTIPNGVTSIGNNAFHCCSSLSSITIPNSVTSIGQHVFSYCSGLPSITIPNSVTSIGDYAFLDCSGLTSITIPNSVTSIGEKAFYSCTGLTSVHISDISAWCNISFYGNYSNPLSYAHHLFMNGKEITNLIIPDDVTTIGKYVFYYCYGLTSITIPNSVMSIGESAFSGCYGLTSITIPNSVTNIGIDAFSGCYGLTSITIPNSVTNIGIYAFSGCSGLTSITIPSSVASIGEGSFFDCSGLTSITIPNSVTSIKDNAFYGCSGLTSITIPNSVTSIGYGAFLGCSNVTSLKLPDNLQFIRQSAFSGCSKLKSVTIPSTVEVIYQEAFAGCNSLESVTSQATNPPFLYDNSFSNYSVPLNVPSGCKSAYENAQGWRNFTNISDGNMYYQLSITATGQGTATYNDTPVKNTTATFDVKEGNSAAVTISPDNGYAVSTATVNGEDATAAIVNGVLTISSMSANTTVAITFARASATTAITMENDMQTYCPLDDVDFSNVEGLKAFTATGYDHGTLTVSRVLNAPAGTGLLLQGTAGVTYQVPYATQTGYYINLLHGLTQDTQVSPTTGNQTNFLLGKKNGVTTFYRVAQTGTVSAGKAYLQLPTSVVGDLTGSRVMRIVADDETTGISEALPLNDNGEMRNDNVYDLQGRRVTKPTRGLYIVNGKKVVIK